VIYITGELYEHPSAQILFHLNAHCVTIIVNDRWTSRDVQKIFDAIRMFGRTAHTITVSSFTKVDASILELILAGLSSMDLGRWHAFQCYLRTLNGSVQEDSVHVHCVTCNSDSILWPNLKELSVRVSLNEFPCLSRLKDYNVNPEAIMDVENLCLFRLCLPVLENEFSSDGSP
uniref:Uncharacterized protein n=1 Tax=Parascaris equorum TaxID=6256 RepID=A0A914RX11_PAREQ